MFHGYSDRIHHALAFTAKHHPDRISRYDGHSCLIRASSVAVILARYGSDECTIVSSILKHLVDVCPFGRQASLSTEITKKFGPMVASTVEAAVHPRFDILGRERTWKAARFEQLSRLAAGSTRAVDICVADELHVVGAALVEIARLGVEYSPVHEASVEEIRWWHGAFIECVRSHPTWQRPDMLTELHRLTHALAERAP
jgi:hypothetical protein